MVTGVGTVAIKLLINGVVNYTLSQNRSGFFYLVKFFIIAVMFTAIVYFDFSTTSLVTSALVLYGWHLIVVSTIKKRLQDSGIDYGSLTRFSGNQAQ